MYGGATINIIGYSTGNSVHPGDTGSSNFISMDSSSLISIGSTFISSSGGISTIISVDGTLVGPPSDVLSLGESGFHIEKSVPSKGYSYVSSNAEASGGGSLDVPTAADFHDSSGCAFLTCRTRWSFRPNFCGQKGHRKSRLPVCTTRCRRTSLAVKNFRSQ